MNAGDIIPRDLAVCPICGADLIVDDITEWDAETGIPTEAGFSLACTTEPEIDSGEWREWHAWHYAAPYVDWLPVEVRVYKFLAQEATR